MVIFMQYSLLINLLLRGHLHFDDNYNMHMYLLCECCSDSHARKSVQKLIEVIRLQIFLLLKIIYLRPECQTLDKCSYEFLFWYEEIDKISFFVLQARIAFLQGERKGQENLKNDLVRRIKMLEYALKQERWVISFSKSLFNCIFISVPRPLLHWIQD